MAVVVLVLAQVVEPVRDRGDLRIAALATLLAIASVVAPIVCVILARAFKNGWIAVLGVVLFGVFGIAAVAAAIIYSATIPPSP